VTGAPPTGQTSNVIPAQVLLQMHSRLLRLPDVANANAFAY